MLKLAKSRLEKLRDELRRRGSRQSISFPSATPDLVEAMEVVQEYGPMCEAMYLMMAADGRVLDVERKVMRGALDVLSSGRVRTAHMEAMIDASSKRVGELGEERCLQEVIDHLDGDPVRAETTVLLSAAIALADGRIAPEEQALLEKMAAGLGLAEGRANQLLEELSASVETG